MLNSYQNKISTSITSSVFSLSKFCWQYYSLQSSWTTRDSQNSCAMCQVASVVSDCDRWTVACQAPLSMGFSRWKYWNGLPFLTPEDPPNPGTEPTSLASPALASGFFTTSTTWKASLGTYFIAERLHPLNNTSLFPSPWQSVFLLYIPEFYFLNIYYTYKHYMQHMSFVSGLFHLALCPPGSSMLSFVPGFLYFLTLNNNSLHIIPHHFYSFICWQKHCSSILAIVNNFALNKGVQKSLWDILLLLNIYSEMDCCVI